MGKCAHCDLSFEKRKGVYQKYCTPECRNNAANARERKDYYKQYFEEKRNTEDWYVDRLVQRARAVTKDTDITKEFVRDLLRGCDYRCSLTKLPLKYENDYGTFHSPLAPSLDQIVPAKGYYKENVWILATFVNRAKGEIAIEDFCKLINSIKFPVGNDALCVNIDTRNYENECLVHSLLDKDM